MVVASASSVDGQKRSHHRECTLMEIGRTNWIAEANTVKHVGRLSVDFCHLSDWDSYVQYLRRTCKIVLWNCQTWEAG